MKNQFLLYISVLVLSACGGGGDPSNSTPASSIPPNQPTNTAPSLTLNPTSITMDENTSYEVALSFADADGDSVNITVEESHNYLTTSVSGQTLTLTTSNVDSNQQTTIYVIASDGKSNTRKPLSLTVNNIIEPVNNSAPVTEMSTINFEMEVGNSLEFITYTILDPDGDAVPFETLEYQATEGLTVNPYNGYFDVIAQTLGQKSVSFSMEDSKGNRSDPFTFYVNVIEVDTGVINEHVPVLRFNSAPDGTPLIITMLPNQEIYNTFTITDEDEGSLFTCSIEFEDIDNIPDSFSYELDCANRWLIFKTEEVKEYGFISFRVTANDGQFTSAGTAIAAIFDENDQGQANIVVEEFEGSFFKVGQNETKTLLYTIEDDKPEDVEFDLIENWYGDLDEVFVSHEDGQFTISSNEAGDFGETYGFFVHFKDGSNRVTFNLEVKIFADSSTEINQEALKVIERYQNSLTQTREFSLIGNLYTDYLFNVGKITDTEKEQYENQFYSENRDAYHLINVYISIIQIDIDTNVFNEDPEHLGGFVSLFKSFMNDMKLSGQGIAPVINELAALDSKLFQVEFSSEFQWLDEDETKSSKFIGNTTYGDYNDSDKWVYDSEYKLLRALSQITNTTDIVE
jgi:hypothetical protein